MASGGPPYYGRWPVGSVYEARLDGTWVSATPEQVTISATPGPSATVSTYSGYIVFKFTASGTLNVGAGNPGPADVFVVGGGLTGGSGATGPTAGSGGTGGTGGSRTASPAITITANSPIPVTVGAGGNNASSFGPVSSSGGTAGGSAGANGPSNDYETGSSATYGGGGGPGGPFIFPQLSPIAGGGGGSSGGGPGGPSGYNRPIPVGGPVPGNPGTAGTTNTGGGGGGGGSGMFGAGSGGTGGSGVVIVRFPTTYFKQ